MTQDSMLIIAPKQTPVINRLNETMNQALAYAKAIRDNAQDDGQPIPAELVASFQDDYNNIIAALNEAHHLAS
jgi:F0F1-type ATP synthase membrane subunit b/b'